MHVISRQRSAKPLLPPATRGARRGWQRPHRSEPLRPGCRTGHRLSSAKPRAPATTRAPPDGPGGREARSPRGRARTEWAEPPRTRAVYVRNSSGEREDDAMRAAGRRRSALAVRSARNVRQLYLRTSAGVIPAAAMSVPVEREGPRPSHPRCAQPAPHGGRAQLCACACDRGALRGRCLSSKV